MNGINLGTDFNIDLAQYTISENKRANIALIGFMGSGKSTIGARLTQLCGRKFVDTDTLIEKRSGKSIPRILKLISPNAEAGPKARLRPGKQINR